MEQNELLIQHNWCLYSKQRRNTHTDMCTEGKSPGKEEDRDWEDAGTSQGAPSIAGNHQKLRERTWPLLTP